MTDLKSKAAARSRFPAGPLSAAVALAVGIAIVWGCVVGWSSQAFGRRSREYYERVAVTSDGTPIIYRSYGGTLQRTGYFTLDRKPYAAHEPPEISGAQVADRPAVTATRPREEPVVLAYSDARSRPTAWYFAVFGNPAGKGYFAGYDVLTRERVGYIGREGFQVDRPADGQFIAVRRTNLYSTSSFIVPAQNESQGFDAYGYVNPPTRPGNIPVWICHVVSGDRLLRVDLRERNVRTVLETPGLFSVSVAQRPRPDSASQGNRRPEFDDCLVVRSPDTATVLDWQDRVEKTYRLPTELKDTWFTFYPAANGKAAAAFYDHFRPQRFPLSFNVVEFAADGTVSHSASHITDAPLERDDRALVSFGAPELIVPLAITLLAPFNAEADDTWVGYASAFAEIFGEFWPLYLSGGILGLVSVVLYRRHAVRTGNSPSITWMTFVFLFGIPGFLGYLWHRRWPVRLACPACRSDAPRDRDNCARCGTLFPAPAANGLEIFA
jgi:hypothetical protein